MSMYAALADSDDEEQPKVAEKKVTKEATKPAAAGAKKDTGAKPAAKAPEPKKEIVGGPKKPVAEKPKEEKPKAPATAEPAEEVAKKDNNRGGHARGRDNKGGRGRGNGNYENAEGQTRPKREFDRKPSQGRGRGEASKGGRGPFGAGNPSQDAKDAEKDPNSAEEVLEPVDAAVEEEPEVVAEPEPATFTLDQYLEKRNAARSALLSQETKVRQVDKSALAGLAKKEDEGDVTYMPVKASKADTGKKDQRSTSKTQVLDVGFKFESVQIDDAPRGGRGGRGGRGDRDGRGAGRGEGRGRGAGRGGRPSSGKPEFNNSDFPSL